MQCKLWSGGFLNQRDATIRHAKQSSQHSVGPPSVRLQTNVGPLFRGLPGTKNVKSLLEKGTHLTIYCIVTKSQGYIYHDNIWIPQHSFEKVVESIRLNQIYNIPVVICSNLDMTEYKEIVTLASACNPLMFTVLSAPVHLPKIALA